MGWTRRSVAFSVLAAVEAQQREIARRVAHLRDAKGWTNEKLAYESGLSVKTISRVVNARHEPRGDTVRALATVFDVSEADIRGPMPAPLGLGVSQADGDSELVDKIKLLVERVGTLEQVIADFGELLEARLPAAAPRRRRASGS